MRISIVIPVFQEAERIEACLDHALAQSAAGHAVEVIVVDGGSNDGTMDRVRERQEKLGAQRVRGIVAPRRGRARQLNAGAREAKGNVLLFLHVDTQLPEDALPRVIEAIGEQVPQADYGWFTVRVASGDPRLRIASRIWSTRSRLFVSSTGDQAQFFGRDFFFRIGGYPPLDLCEDLAILRHAKKLGRHACIDAPVLTSARRWEANGVNRTIVKMLKLRAMYHLGVRHERLAREWRTLSRG
jgi:rSAM/selenodomain-associated transferase 2